ncbi:3'-5' exonuclease-like [Humulus lupulus]|uniref:3'-5' exonuclease-like n=1 Tax=Humulus lupulus TaxID=3486 RepID=UPI002B413688|nr:3'-5' exonuclease-like [Humulus lupulus]
MQINIVDHELSSDTHNLYDVQIGLQTTVRTLVTTSPSMVDSWIEDIERIHNRRLRRLIVGLDVEWRPSFNRYIENPVAIIQLCVGHRCLIFQLLHAESIPSSLAEFLGNSDYSFVGVGVGADVEKLLLDYQLSVRNPVELGDLAARKHDDRSLKNAGLKRLAMFVLGMEIDKPKRITMSRWDNRYLNSSQVQYACVDAYVSFEIGKVLMTEAGAVA